MSRRVQLDPRAVEELDQAAEWYERQRGGLGPELVLEVRATLLALADRPRIGSPIDGIEPALDVRRVRVRRFPYQVVYVMRGQDVVVIAVAHDRRQPGYWDERVR